MPAGRKPALQDLNIFPASENDYAEAIFGARIKDTNAIWAGFLPIVDVKMAMDIHK